MSNRLLHTKVSKRKPLQHFPKKEDGHDGDMQIVSIKGKGTYLCIKDKGEWKISEKFNPRNKFDTHIFDEITTKKIKSRGGLIATFKSSTESIGAFFGKEFTLESNATQPIFEIGDGINLGVLSSHESTSLFLRSGGSSSSGFLFQSSGKINAAMTGASKFHIDWNDNSSGTGELLLTNRSTSAGASTSVNLSVRGSGNTNYNDSYINYIYEDSTATNSRQWAHGVDGNATSAFCLNYYGGTYVDKTLTPSSPYLVSGNFGDKIVKIESDGDFHLMQDNAELTLHDGSYSTGFKAHASMTGNAIYTLPAALPGSNQILQSDSSGNLTWVSDTDTDTTYSAGSLLDLSGTTFNVDLSELTDGTADVVGSADELVYLDAGSQKRKQIDEIKLGQFNNDQSWTSVTNHITNDADDIMAGTLTIDKNTTATSTSTVKGVFIDYDHTGISASGQTITGIGLDLDMNCESVTHVGTVNQTGIDVTLVAATDGIQVQAGIKTNVSGGDKNYDIQLTHDSTNYCTFETSANGATTIATNDSDGAAGHLTLDPNGDLIISGADVKIDSGKDLYLDGGSDTYIYESAEDTVRYVVGGDIMMFMEEKGDNGNEIKIDACVGFDQKEPAYDAANTAVDFRFSNKQFVTFGAGNITNLNLYFPLVSGNFVLLVKQDGTGSRTITTYKAREYDETPADGSLVVVWAGGSAPTLTTDANHVDILSFYWDADNEIAYGMATLDFQF